MGGGADPGNAKFSRQRRVEAHFRYGFWLGHVENLLAICPHYIGKLPRSTSPQFELIVEFGLPRHTLKAQKHSDWIQIARHVIMAIGTSILHRDDAMEGVAGRFTSST